jgi:hypothetical protein
MSEGFERTAGQAAVFRSKLRIPTRVVVAASTQIGALRPSYFANRVHRPHFIVGCGRSGTTMLNYLFNLHPEVANFPSEANHLWHPRIYPWHESKIESPPFWFDPQRFTEISLAQRRPGDDQRLKATFGAFQALSRKPVFLTKTVTVTFMMDKVLELFPDARFIHIVRDGRAVALSWVAKNREKLKHPRFLEKQIHHTDEELLEIYVRYWQSHVLALDEAVKRLGLGSDRYHEMRYEEVCEDPTAHMVALAEYLGVSPEPFRRAPLDHIKNSNGKARATILGDQLQRLNLAGAAALESRHYGSQIA